MNIALYNQSEKHLMSHSWRQTLVTLVDNYFTNTLLRYTDDVD